MDPYLPLDELKPVAHDVWIADGPEIGFGPGPLKFPFPTRMTLVRLPNGGLWLHSPIRPAERLFEQVAALGSVRALIAPNTLHYWWVPDWKKRFPDAPVFAAPGLERKAKRPLPIDRVLGDEPPPEWTDVIDQVLVRSPALTEVDFFHRPSRTLVLADLIENFETGRIHSWLQKLIVRLGGVVDPDGKTPADLQMSLGRRNPKVRAALQRMIDWAPERVILAHGRWYQRDGARELGRAFRWALGD